MSKKYVFSLYTISWNCSSPCFWGMIFPWSLPGKLGWLLSSLPPWHWLSRCNCHAWLFTWVLDVKFRVSGLCCKHFTNRAISPALHSTSRAKPFLAFFPSLPESVCIGDQVWHPLRICKAFDICRNTVCTFWYLGTCFYLLILFLLSILIQC